MDIDNRSVVAGNCHILELTTPVAHLMPGHQEITGAELTAGNGHAELISDGFYNGDRLVSSDAIRLNDTKQTGYYQITAKGKGSVSSSAVTKQVTVAGHFYEDTNPVDVISPHTAESNEAEQLYYIKKSTISTERISPSSSEQTVTIGEGYYPAQRTVTVAPVQESVKPTTSMKSTNMDTYFYSANKDQFDISVTPRYSTPAGFVEEVIDGTNGGAEYYIIKRITSEATSTTVSGNTATRGHFSVSEGWNDNLIRLDPALFKKEATSGKTYVDISNTTDAPELLTGDYLYIDAGYVDNLKISLAKLIPDSDVPAASANYILSGYSAYDNDGDLLIGTIRKYDGSYTLT